MSKITPPLWYDGTAEEAANFYVTLLPDSRIEAVNPSPIDTPSGPAGIVLTVVFTLAGQRFCGLNGGPQFPHSEAVSFTIETEDQAETDRLSDAIASNGGQPGPCGWIKDRWGFSWQQACRAGAGWNRPDNWLPAIRWNCDDVARRRTPTARSPSFANSLFRSAPRDKRDRGFESASLQQGVTCEPNFLDQVRRRDPSPASNAARVLPAK
jgi:predicted 3-demethylubiquinone-9 3-methyltransferase (glyoxalase superfamily)